MTAALSLTGPRGALISIWNNKHYEFYQQIVDNLNLTGGLGDHSNYSDVSDSVSSRSRKYFKASEQIEIDGDIHHKASLKKNSN